MNDWYDLLAAIAKASLANRIMTADQVRAWWILELGTVEGRHANRS